MNWKSLFLSNWPYKLAALVLALLLWFSVSAEERLDYPVPTNLEVEVRDSAWVLVSVPEEVQTYFQTQRGEAMGLTFGEQPVIRIVIDSVDGPTRQVPIRPDMVEYNTQLNARPMEVRPAEIELQLEPRVERRLPVRAELRTSAAEGFTVVREAILQPESVTVTGAESEVASMADVPTERVELEDLRSSFTRELTLLPPPGVPTVSVDPRAVLATVEVDSLVERAFRRPLDLSGAAASAAVSPRDSVDVVVRGAGGSLMDLTAGDVVAEVTVDSLPAGGASFPVRVRLPDGVSATASASPSEVTLRRSRAEP